MRYVALVLFLLAACSSTTGNATVDEPIEIGLLIPQSGNWATYGEWVLQGVQLAQEERPTVDGDVVSIIVDDTAGKERGALAGAHRLIAGGINYMIGSPLSWETLAVAPVVEQAHVLYLAPGSAAPAVRDAGEYVFRNKISADEEARQLAEVFASKKRAAIITVNNDWGRGVASAFAHAFTGEIVYEDYFSDEERDFRILLQKSEKKQPEIVLIGGSDVQASHILRQARELGIDAQFFIQSGSLGPALLDEDAAEGLIVLSEFDGSMEAKQFKELYENEHGAYSYFAAMGYDAYHIMLNVVEVCGQDTSCARGYLLGMPAYQGAAGLTAFDRNGDVARELVPMVLHDGELVELQR